MQPQNESLSVLDEIKQDLKRINEEIELVQIKMKKLLHEADLIKFCLCCGNPYRAVKRKKYCSDSCRVTDFRNRSIEEATP